MNNTKIIDTLRVLSREEWKQLGLFVNSPYHNQQHITIQLFDILKAYLAGRGKVKVPDRKEVFAHHFPGVPFSDAKIRHVISSLLEVVRRFFIEEELKNDSVMETVYLLKVCNRRGLSKVFDQAL